MPQYPMRCTECDYIAQWDCSVKDYDDQKGCRCPKCKKGIIVQDFSKRTTVAFVLKGMGFTRKIGSSNNGSQSALDSALWENDALMHINKTPEGRKKEYAVKKMEDMAETEKAKAQN